MVASVEVKKEVEVEVKEPVLLDGPAGVDVWHPTVKQVKGKTNEEKLVYINEVIDLGSSDTQFAAKMKAALQYILVDVENEPDPEPEKTEKKTEQKTTEHKK